LRLHFQSWGTLATTATSPHRLPAGCRVLPAGCRLGDRLVGEAERRGELSPRLARHPAPEVRRACPRLGDLGAAAGPAEGVGCKPGGGGDSREQAEERGQRRGTAAACAACWRASTNAELPRIRSSAA